MRRGSTISCKHSQTLSLDCYIQQWLHLSHRNEYAAFLSLSSHQQRNKTDKKTEHTNTNRFPYIRHKHKTQRPLTPDNLPLNPRLQTARSREIRRPPLRRCPSTHDGRNTHHRLGLGSRDVLATLAALYAPKTKTGVEGSHSQSRRHRNATVTGAGTVGVFECRD